MAASRALLSRRVAVNLRSTRHLSFVTKRKFLCNLTSKKGIFIASVKIQNFTNFSRQIETSPGEFVYIYFHLTNFLCRNICHFINFNKTMDLIQKVVLHQQNFIFCSTRKAIKTCQSSCGQRCGHHHFRLSRSQNEFSQRRSHAGHGSHFQ